MFGQFPEPPEDSVHHVNWEGWTPPWQGREGPGPEGPGQGFGGPRHGWGHRGGPGPEGPRHGWGHRGWQGPRGPFFGPGRHWGIPDELLALRVQATEVARLFAIASRGAFNNKERLARLRVFLDRSHDELTEIIYGSSQEAGEQASSSPDTGEA